MEILIALTLLGIIGTLVTVNVLEKLEEGRIKTANLQMASLSAALKEYKRKCGIYPTTEQGLEALISKPTGGRECKNYPPNGFLSEEFSEIPADPWDEPYYYGISGRKKLPNLHLWAGSDGGWGRYECRPLLSPQAKGSQLEAFRCSKF